MNSVIIDKTINYVKNELADDASGHDWWHVHRVYKLAKYIAKKEGADVFVVELAALLHDISDWKLNGGDENLGGQVASEWLYALGVDVLVVDHVSQIINTMCFKGAGVKDSMVTLEGKIVQDADRLDAIGAIGIARTFAYGGSKHRAIYDPELKPTLHASFEQYKKNNSSTINHFYEKLLLLNGRLNTETAKIIAKERHMFMEQYLNEFFKEWDFHE